MTVSLSVTPLGFKSVCDCQSICDPFRFEGLGHKNNLPNLNGRNPISSKMKPLFFIHPKFTKRFFAVTHRDYSFLFLLQTRTEWNAGTRGSVIRHRRLWSITRRYLSELRSIFLSSHPQSCLDDDRENVHRSRFQKLGLNRNFYFFWGLICERRRCERRLRCAEFCDEVNPADLISCLACCAN